MINRRSWLATAVSSLSLLLWPTKFVFAAVMKQRPASTTPREFRDCYIALTRESRPLAHMQFVPLFEFMAAIKVRGTVAYSCVIDMAGHSMLLAPSVQIIGCELHECPSVGGDLCIFVPGDPPANISGVTMILASPSQYPGMELRTRISELNLCGAHPPA